MTQQPEIVFELNVQIAPAFAANLAEAALQDVVRAALRQDPPEGPVSLSLVVTDDAEIQRLNRDYRGIDAPTDVLSFGMGEDQFAPEEQALYLGDIILSYPRAAAQAQEYGHSAQAEVNLLVVHGVLHLLGYDHATAEEEREMWSLQERALQEQALQAIALKSLPF
jgi:probable rRNA maturation factor